MNQGVVVWFTGLPASGKTTLARHVRDQIAPRRPCVVLDSDELRAALGATMYDEASRAAFYRSVREVAALLVRQGLVVLVAATAPRRDHRTFARENAPTVIEVYVRTPLEVCAARDPKGLYAAAASDRSTTLPGVGEVFEPPLSPSVVADGGEDAAAVDAIVELVR